MAFAWDAEFLIRIEFFYKSPFWSVRSPLDATEKTALTILHCSRHPRPVPATTSKDCVHIFCTITVHKSHA